MVTRGRVQRLRNEAGIKQAPLPGKPSPAGPPARCMRSTQGVRESFFPLASRFPPFFPLLSRPFLILSYCFSAFSYFFFFFFLISPSSSSPFPFYSLSPLPLTSTYPIYCLPPLPTPSLPLSFPYFLCPFPPFPFFSSSVLFIPFLFLSYLFLPFPSIFFMFCLSLQSVLLLSPSPPLLFFPFLSLPSSSFLFPYSSFLSPPFLFLPSLPSRSGVPSVSRPLTLACSVPVRNLCLSNPRRASGDREVEGEGRERAKEK